MPQHISFGNLNTMGERVTIGSRFIDTNALMEHSLKDKKEPIHQIEDQVSISENAINAYYEMQRLLEKLQQELRPLQTASLYGYGLNSVFESQLIDAQTNNSKPASYYCDIQANGEQIISADSFEFQILQIAKPHILQTVKVDSSTDDITQLKNESNDDDDNSKVNNQNKNKDEDEDESKEQIKSVNGARNNKFNCGVFKINGINITVEQGNSLRNIADNINAAAANVTASINSINKQYRLVLESQQTGVAGAMNINDASNVLNGMFGNLTNNVISENLRSAAQDAQLMFVDDVDVYAYSNNIITEFIPGLTLSLYRPTNYDAIQLEMTGDGDLIMSSMLNFIGAYNQFMDFAAAQQRRERTEQGNIRYSSDSYLHSNTGLLSIQNILYQTISNFQTTNTGEYQSIYNIYGIEQPRISSYGEAGLNAVASYKLHVNKVALQQYISNNVQELRQFMQSSIASNSTRFTLLKSGSFLSLGNFTVNINATETTNLSAALYYYDYDVGQLKKVTATFNLYNATDVTQGGVISANNDEMFGDLLISYKGQGGLDYADFNTSYGLADQLGDTLDTALVTQNIVDIGLLDLQMKKESLQYKLARAQADYDRTVKQATNNQLSTSTIERQNIIIEQLVQQAAAAYSRQ